MCCRAIKTNQIGVAVIAYQCALICFAYSNKLWPTLGQLVQYNWILFPNIWSQCTLETFMLFAAEGKGSEH